MMETEYKAIRDGLRRLRKSIFPLKVFGSQSHGFRTYPPLSEQTVREFETRHHISLPSEYRGFLIHVGNGGAGPAYGLFKLGEMDDGFEHEPWNENDGFIGVLSQPFPHTSPWNDLSEEPIYDESWKNDPEQEDEYYRQVDLWEERVYWNTANINGAIPICHLGCALRQWLVVTGPEAGNVWDDYRADRGGLEPLQRPGQERVSFLQWYRLWLDDALRQLWF
jgi:hypothetical protein